MTSLITTALAAGSALLILVLLSMHEARLRAHAAASAPELETTPEVFPLDFEEAPDPAAGGELCIIASRARCVCGRARELHDLRSDPGCRRFEYAGGLAAAPSREPVEAR